VAQGWARECPEGTGKQLPMRVYLEPRFEADVCYFAQGPASYLVEVFVSICNDDLQFVRREGRFLARYDVTVLARARGGRQVGGDQFRRSRWVDTYDETARTDPCPLERVRIKMDPGEYSIVVRVQDIDSGAESEAEQKIVLPEGGEAVWFSSPKFLEGARAPGGSVTGEGRVEVRRAYGDSLPTMRVYVELYGVGARPEPGEIIYQIDDVEGRRVAEGLCRRLGARGFGLGYAVEQPTDSLSIGLYDLRIMAKGEEKLLAAACGRFRVSASGALWNRDFEKTLDLIGYIATSDEMNALKRAPEDGRKEAWEAFWAGRDPTPGTSRNEVRDEFFERVSYANEHFGEPLAEGWQTDRGRVYITEGPPDAIDSHPIELSTGAWEAWHYYRRSITYIFVDKTGFGQYILVGTR